MRIGRLAQMTPRVLCSIGHPNEFIVLDVFETDSDGVCLALWPCCHRFKKAGKKICPGHPAVYFEKTGALRTPKKGDKSSSLVLPFLGEVLGFDYEEGAEGEEGGEAPKMTANIFGLKSGASGYWAKLLKKLAEDAKII